MQALRLFLLGKESIEDRVKGLQGSFVTGGLVISVYEYRNDLADLVYSEIFMPGYQEDFQLVKVSLLLFLLLSILLANQPQ